MAFKGALSLCPPAHSKGGSCCGDWLGDIFARAPAIQGHRASWAAALDVLADVDTLVATKGTEDTGNGFGGKAGAEGCGFTSLRVVGEEGSYYFCHTLVASPDGGEGEVLGLNYCGHTELLTAISFV